MFFSFNFKNKQIINFENINSKMGRKFFVGGNWKMNNLKKDNEALIGLLNNASINFETTGNNKWKLTLMYF